MDALNLSQNDRVIDGRRARSWWHQRAKEMKAAGVPVREIARHFGKTKEAVKSATKSCPSPNSPKLRMFTKSAEGFKRGKLNRMAVGFTDEQMANVNALAEAKGKSFSAVVAELVSEALNEQPSEFNRLMEAQNV